MIEIIWGLFNSIGHVMRLDGMKNECHLKNISDDRQWFMASREKSLILPEYHRSASKIKNQSYSRLYHDCDGAQK